eukprot:CAMPEP_0197247408 /NCGR_PEP_ID=MMETSP1429-20130617/29175_1 /TAXON_ID=49237 /ORGANISM="Chaetoceros  sp., Strain UNC1202" /LENGTH=150 /DNA_ID=CAMNT_0042708313 /DNA_START=21 /DNA_END=473 /DNA_ORIENTATION=+
MKTAVIRILSFLFLSNFCASFTPSLSSAASSIGNKNQALKMSETNSNESATKPFSIVVDAKIEPARREEFLDLIEKDAVGSRAEAGCLRFDVLESQDEPNRFFFYEVYTDTDAVAFHKEQPHFALWTDFKASGGVVSATSFKCDGLFMSS